MIRHIFLDKCNTINKDSKLNTGLNPVVELNTGKHISRILLHFDVNDLKENVKSGNYQIENLKHILKMYNCGSINLPSFEEEVNIGTYNKVRASSFDVYAFILPYEWDRGRGFDSEISYLKGSNTVNKKEGSTWFNTRTHNEWDEPGVYSYETLINNETLIVAKQHFDSGLEDLELDITDYVNNLLLDKLPNFGLGLMFCPEYEQSEDDLFVSFFGPETNTFFNPYVETTNSELILDNRYNFHLGVSNKLYFFVSDNGEYFDLDEIPTCTINDETYLVQKAGKGIYYVEIKLKTGEVEPDTILYDIWSNIVLNGEKIDDIEMEFVVLPMEKRYNIGKAKTDTVNIEPSFYGINMKECIKKGDIREVNIDFIEEFSRGKKVAPTKAEYRLYVKEGNREIDVFPYQLLEKLGDQYQILINTNDLIPNVYYIDLKVTQGREVKFHDKFIEFKLVDNVTIFKI